MDKFNNQFATQKLRQEAGNNWPETITSRYRDEYLFIHDENKPGFYNVQDVSTGKIVGRLGFRTPENAVKFAQDKIKPQGGRQSSGFGESSVTGTGASFTPGTGEQMATNKAFKKKPKTEEKDVEPKLAAGKAKVYMKNKWGWKDAPSVPNRPSKGGFIYKQLFEELSYVAFNHYRSTLNDAYGDLVRDNNPGAKVVGSAYDSLNVKDNPESISKLDAAKEVIVISKLVPQQKNTYLQAIDKIKEYLTQSPQNNINESLDIDDVVKVVYGNEFYGKTGKILDTNRGFIVVGFMYDQDGEYLDWDESLEDDREIDVEEYSMHSSDVEKVGGDEPVSDYGKYRKDPDYYEKDYQEKGTSDYFQRRGLDEIEQEDKIKIIDRENKYFGRTGKVHDIHDDNTAMIIVDAPGSPTTTVDIAKLKSISGLNENYSKFKTETKTRGKSDQFHQAVREVRKKVLEINRLFEYVSRLKSELSEGEGGLKYKIHTEKALAKIKEMVSELNQNIKKFK